MAKMKKHAVRCNTWVCLPLVSLAVSLLLLVSSPNCALALTPADLYRHAKAATVLIVGINEESAAIALGSGVFISEQGLILTNAHVVEDSPQLYVYIRNQTIDTTVRVLAIDSDLDLGWRHSRHSTAPKPLFPSNTYMRLTVLTV